MQDSEYIQPENETIDWLVYAEYLCWKLSQSTQDSESIAE